SPLLGERDPGLSAEGWFRASHMTYPYGVQIAVARVDGDTGAVMVERYLIAYDIGRAINPMLVEGQLVGGVVQGLGGALSEEFRYDERGEPLSVTLADYRMPTASDIPPIEVLITEDAPSPLNPLGIKSAAEGGISPVGAVSAAPSTEREDGSGTLGGPPSTPAAMNTCSKPLFDDAPAGHPGNPGLIGPLTAESTAELQPSRKST